MSYNEFVEKSRKQDERNVFVAGGSVKGLFEKELELFYNTINPIDVEVAMKGKYVRFYPFEQIESLQLDYHLKEGTTVFSTCDSDPIFLFDGKVYGCYHSSSDDSKWEKIADSFNDFLDLVD